MSVNTTVAADSSDKSFCFYIDNDSERADVVTLLLSIRLL